jgi:hypothetical protein
MTSIRIASALAAIALTGPAMAQGNQHTPTDRAQIPTQLQANRCNYNNSVNSPGNPPDANCPTDGRSLAQSPRNTSPGASPAETAGASSPAGSPAMRKDTPRPLH